MRRLLSVIVACIMLLVLFCGQSPGVGSQVKTQNLYATNTTTAATLGTINVGTSAVVADNQTRLPYDYGPRTMRQTAWMNSNTGTYRGVNRDNWPHRWLC